MVGRMMKEKPTLPYGFMAGFSKDVLRMIPRCHMGGKAKDLLTLIVADAFGDAGREMEHPEEAGLWCNTNNATWAAALSCKKQYITQVLADLEKAGIISRHQTETDKDEDQAPIDWRTYTPQRLRLEPDFTKWLPLQEPYALSRYTRQGAGRPRKKASEGKSLDSEQQAEVNPQISDSQGILREIAANQVGRGTTPASSVPALTISRISKDLPVPGKNGSKDLPVVASGRILDFTPPSSRVRGETASEVPKKSYEKKEITEEESANADALATPDAAPLPDAAVQVSSSSPETPQQAAMFAGEPKQEPTAKPPASRKKAASKTGVTREQQAAMWIAWDACDGTIKQADIGKDESSQHYRHMTSLVQQGITPEMLPAFVAAKHQLWEWKAGTYRLKPWDIVGDLATLRPIVRGEVPVKTARSNGYSLKGANHAGLRRHTGEWTGNHGRDADLVKRC